jgi:hypothetical protein
MRIWQNGRKSSISYDREFGKKYDGNLVLYTMRIWQNGRKSSKSYDR